MPAVWLLVSGARKSTPFEHCVLLDAMSGEGGAPAAGIRNAGRLMAYWNGKNQDTRDSVSPPHWWRSGLLAVLQPLLQPG